MFVTIRQKAMLYPWLDSRVFFLDDSFYSSVSLILNFRWSGMHSGVWVFERYRVVGESFEAVLDSCYRLMMLTSSLRDILFNIQQLCGPNFMVLGDPRFISLHLCDHVEFLVIFMRVNLAT